MDFHKAYEETLNHLPWVLLADIVSKKLEQEGIHITEKEKDKIAKWFEDGHLDTLPIKRWRWWDRKAIHIELSESDADNVARRLEGLHKELPVRMLEVIDGVAPMVVKALLNHIAEDTKAERKQSRLFENHIWRIWREPFSRLYLLVDLATRAGANVIEICKSRPQDQPQLVDVVVRLQARGVQVTREILSLMESGYADGATARWRTLHEIMVVACFISDHGNECAARYIDHDSVEVYKGARLYQKYCSRLNYQPIPDAEFVSIQKASDEMMLRYGKEFAEDYGWATPYLREPGGKSSFAQIEKSIDLDHFRPLVRDACQPVHAAPRGIFHKVGLMNDDLVLFNSSDYGFADVGRNTGLSLTLLTAQLMPICPVLDLIISGYVMSEVSLEAGSLFYKTQEMIEAAS
jgi:hypothetical protein